jgi:peptidoglycan L-alanyl-D-glutamate endopeptidase CwlK
MPSFSQRSKRARAELHRKLQELVDEAIKEVDFVILDAQRGRAEQERAFKDGFSKAHFGQSAHNYEPAVAMDICPYPIDWNDIGRFKALSKVIMAAAKKQGIALTFGGDWKSIKDYPHYEFTDWKGMVKRGEVKLIED